MNPHFESEKDISKHIDCSNIAASRTDFVHSAHWWNAARPIAPLPSNHESEIIHEDFLVVREKCTTLFSWP